MTVKTIAYVSNADSQEVLVLEMDRRSGALELLQRAPVAGTAMPIAISPDRRHLHVGIRSEPYGVASFRIDPASGRLDAIATTPLSGDFAYIATDRAGRFLLAASYWGSKIAINAIGANGFVQTPPVQELATPPKAHAILADPSNRRLHVPCLGGDIVLRLDFDAHTGRVGGDVSVGARTPSGAGPRHFRFHPSNAFMYVLNELDGTLCVFAHASSSGETRMLQTVDAKPLGLALPPAASDIHMTPNGRFLYASVRGSNTLAGFAADPVSGLLSPIGHWPTETMPRGFAICPRGKFLVAAGQESHSLTTYRIDGASGRLEAGLRTPMGKNPNWVEIVELP